MTTGTTTGSLLPHAAAVAPVAADKTTAANRASVGTIGAAPLLGLLLALAAWGLLHAVPALAPWERLLYLPAYLCVSLGVWREAGESLRRGDFFNEFTLMLIATVGALALGDCPERWA